MSGLDAGLHYLDAGPEEIARYVLVLDAINFGSGWFDTLRLPAGESGTEAMTRALTAHARARGGTWTPGRAARDRPRRRSPGCSARIPRTS